MLLLLRKVRILEEVGGKSEDERKEEEVEEVTEVEEVAGSGGKKEEGLEEEETSLPSLSWRQKAHMPPGFAR